MNINVPGILSSPVSHLSPISSDEYLSDQSLFLVETHQNNDENKTPTGYVSRQGLYQQLTSTFVSDFHLKKTIAELQNMEMSLEVPPAYVELENSSASRRFILSAISENKRASINGVSVYNMADATKDILSKVEVPRVESTISPWVKTSQIETTMGSSVINVAAQNLLLSVKNEIDTGKYLETSSVKNTVLTPLATNVAAQSLITGVKGTTENEIINTADVVNALGTATDKVASQALVSNISNAISSNYHMLSNLATTIGPSRTNGASVALLNDLSNNINTNFITIEDIKKYLTTEKVVSYLGNSTTLVSSQKLATDISSNVTEIKNEITQKLRDQRPTPQPYVTGNVYYLTPDGIGKSQTIADDQIFLCESTEDIKKTTSNSTMRIGDIKYNKVSSYNGTRWVVESDKLPITVTGAGRLSKNPYTGKLFYSTRDKFIKLYQPPVTVTSAN